MVKTLFIYSGTDRKELEKQVKEGQSPDTSFFGLTVIKRDSQIEADYLQINKETYSFAGSLTRRYRVLRLIYLFFKFYKLFKNQDVIVITSSIYFDLLLYRKLGFFRSQRWFILNLDLNIAFKKRKNHRFSHWLLFTTISEAKKVICISQHQRKYLLSLSFVPEQVIFIPLGTDQKFYQPLTFSKEFILTIGRDMGRDVANFLEAVRLSKESTVMICSPQNIKGFENKIPPNLTVLFDLPYTELRKYYEKAKIFVIATKPADYLMGSDCPGQTVILDTLAYGLPIIATSMPWFEGYFKNGENIIIVPPEDPKALSEALKMISNDNKLLKTLSTNGRKLIETTCNSEAMGKKIIELILDTV